MYDTTIPSINQSFPIQKTLNITGSHEVIPLLIQAGISEDEITTDELDSIIVSIEHAAIVYAYCPSPDYVVIEQDSPMGLEQLRIQYKLRKVNEEIELL